MTAAFVNCASRRLMELHWLRTVPENWSLASLKNAAQKFMTCVPSFMEAYHFFLQQAGLVWSQDTENA